MVLRIFDCDLCYDCYVGFAGASPQFYSVGPNRFDHSFVD